MQDDDDAALEALEDAETLIDEVYQSPDIRTARALIDEWYEDDDDEDLDNADDLDDVDDLDNVADDDEEDEEELE